MYAIILCGGSGTRLWPLSRKNYPKQFLNLYSDKSLIQETFLRINRIVKIENLYFITNKENYYNVLNQIKEICPTFSPENILIEPASLNTAPAISMGVKYLTEIKRIAPTDPIIVLPSDHFIRKADEYIEVLKVAINELGDNLATIGITPTKAETGFGYLKKGHQYQNHYQVIEFKEKPNAELAKSYVDSRDYVWNAGMYLFNARTFISELKTHNQEIFDLFKENFSFFIENFNKLPNISIDYAISEKSNKVIVFEGDFDWTDLGSFDSLAEVIKDNQDKPSRHVAHDSKNIFVHSENNRLIATVGVDDLIIIETNDAILVQKKGKSENVKDIVKILKEKNIKEIEHNTIVHRPWGKYEILMDGKKHKAKKITVYPKEKLSLQSHYHRAEHWIVVQGVAKIVNGKDEIILKENESTFIPAFTMHRLENPGKINLEIIEVQTGLYLEEDDIIRYDDKYNR
ncbi:MAG: mannose-1-phosphate guanylyltransferase/mannose-6-phosphate isomerase [Candidatus Falkowbacteria bacterium]|nr:mannose-1-phosphate guanylyltransferase/mannose-6-phosphate isomerase [Candidatus Falkowbacteria bacterium]